jgi:hypothetical protein
VTLAGPFCAALTSATLPISSVPLGSFTPSGVVTDDSSFAVIVSPAFALPESNVLSRRVVTPARDWAEAAPADTSETSARLKEKFFKEEKRMNDSSAEISAMKTCRLLSRRFTNKVPRMHQSRMAIGYCTLQSL